MTPKQRKRARKKEFRDARVQEVREKLELLTADRPILTVDGKPVHPDTIAAIAGDVRASGFNFSEVDRMDIRDAGRGHLLG